ncbi:MAG: Holliday junction branch migration protein RuvA [Candidatus Bruticola sp.]
MISFIEGLCVYSGQGRVVLEVGGIGCEIFVSEPLAARCAVDKYYRLQTLMVVRDNEIFLVGFSSPLEREFYKLLTSISGIGSKAALKILSQLTPADLASCILADDSKSLVKVPGIGAKTSKRIILELKEKIEEMVKSAALVLDASAPREAEQAESKSAESALPGPALEAVSVLMGLGCSKEEAENAVRAALKHGAEADSSNLVMAAVSELGGVE